MSDPMTSMDSCAPALNAMLCLQGQGVVKGFAIGRAVVMSAAALEVEHYRIPSDDIGIECARLRRALAMASNELQSIVRSEEQTSELQSLMRISYAAFCLKKQIHNNTTIYCQQPKA